MILIRQRKNELSIRGHANYDAIGRDIVCAGVSILVYTLQESLAKLTDDEIEYEDDGNAITISWKALSKETQLLIDAFYIGVKALADNFSDYVAII